MKTIAVLTSGGDSPGMNAAVRAVVRSACEEGMRVLGIRRGYTGLINGDMYEMNIRSVSNIIQRGGTILYSARCPEFKTEEGINKAVESCRANGIEGLVVIGGDGSFRGARDLSLKGIPCVGLPGTIDNDISCCDYTIGYDTALSTIMDMVDRLRDTTESHDRCSVVEVMGRRAGYLALNGGIAVGATSILLPEMDFDITRDVIDRMKRTMATGKRHFIVIVAEGAVDRLKEQGIEDSVALSKYIQAQTGVESRTTILGHVQRGGSPTAKDRIVASQMGYYAVQLLKQGIGNRIVGMQKEQIVNYDIYEALNMKKSLDLEIYKIAMDISI